MAIKGKVAGIINERDLIINRGSEAGVTEGMKFKVTEPLQVKDPETGETLETFDREKIRVEIVEVKLKYAVGKTYQTYVVNVGGVGFGSGDLTAGLRRLLEPRQEVTRVRTLRADQTTNLEPMVEASSFVKVGDSVVQILDEV